MGKTLFSGIFLDLDGTLADSMPVMNRAYYRFLEERGGHPDPDEFWTLAGMPLSHIVLLLKQTHALEQSPGDLLRAYYDLVESIYAEEAQPMPGARELLQAAAQRQVFVAVVTSATREQAWGFLKHHGLDRWVRAVVAAQDVAQGKPHPEPYLKALSLSGLSPVQALAVEDSPLGAASALSAGLDTWIMALGQAPDIPGASGRISRLDELTPLLA
jgi:HAD superfamily hydrolase (TIGR01509 family)